MLGSPGQAQGRETPRPAAPHSLEQGSVAGVAFLGGGSSSHPRKALLCELKLFLLALPSRGLLQ